MTSKEKMIQDYKEALEKYGPDDFRSMLWGSKDGKNARLRYDIMNKYCRFESHSVLELGCGLGGLFLYRYTSGEYVGVDILPEYIDYANKNYGASNVQFMVSDMLEYFQNDISGENTKDIVICSGSSAYRGGPTWFPQDLITLLKTAYQHANDAVMFNFPSIYANCRTENIEYYSPSNVLALAQTITPNIILDHSYMNSDFTLILVKQ